MCDYVKQRKKEENENVEEVMVEEKERTNEEREWEVDLNLSLVSKPALSSVVLRREVRFPFALAF